MYVSIYYVVGSSKMINVSQIRHKFNSSYWKMCLLVKQICDEIIPLGFLYTWIKESIIIKVSIIVYIIGWNLKVCM